MPKGMLHLVDVYIPSPYRYSPFNMLRCQQRAKLLSIYSGFFSFNELAFFDTPLFSHTLI